MRTGRQPGLRILNRLDLVDWIGQVPSSGEKPAVRREISAFVPRAQHQGHARRPGQTCAFQRRSPRGEGCAKVRLEQRWEPGYKLLWGERCADHAHGRAPAADRPHPASLAVTALHDPTPEVPAGCVGSARPHPSGGRGNPRPHRPCTATAKDRRRSSTASRSCASSRPAETAGHWKGHVDRPGLRFTRKAGATAAKRHVPARWIPRTRAWTPAFRWESIACGGPRHPCSAYVAGAAEEATRLRLITDCRDAGHACRPKPSPRSAEGSRTNGRELSSISAWTGTRR